MSRATETRPPEPGPGLRLALARILKPSAGLQHLRWLAQVHRKDLPKALRELENRSREPAHHE